MSKNFYKKLEKLGIHDLTKEQIEELKKLSDEITDTAKEVLDDYEKNPTEDTGSVIQIHEESPYMEEKFKGKLWENMKKVGNQYVFSPKNAPKIDSNGVIIDNDTHSQSLSSPTLTTKSGSKDA